MYSDRYLVGLHVSVLLKIFIHCTNLMKPLKALMVSIPSDALALISILISPRSQIFVYQRSIVGLRIQKNKRILCPQSNRSESRTSLIMTVNWQFSSIIFFILIGCRLRQNKILSALVCDSEICTYSQSECQRKS